MNSTKTQIGVIIGDCGFFPGHLYKSGREEIQRVLDQEGILALALDLDETKFWAVETLAEAQKCAKPFKSHREDLAGVIVSLPYFGDERGLANTLRWSGLNLPLLMQAFTDPGGKMTIKDRRDSLRGKISVCNKLAASTIQCRTAVEESYGVVPCDADSEVERAGDMEARHEG